MCGAYESAAPYLLHWAHLEKPGSCFLGMHKFSYNPTNSKSCCNNWLTFQHLCILRKPVERNHNLKCRAQHFQHAEERLTGAKQGQIGILVRQNIIVKMSKIITVCGVHCNNYCI